MANCDRKTLQECYHHTEVGLRNATASGNEKAIRNAMKKHQLVEYALLYQNTPEFKKKQRKSNVKVRK